MGTWDFGVMDDDAVADAYDDYMERFDLKIPHDQIVNELRQKYAEDMDDPDQALLIWLAIAKAQWECGTLQKAVFDRVRTMIEQGGDLNRWAEAGEEAVAKRREALQAFLTELQTPNHQPRKPRKSSWWTTLRRFFGRE